MLATLLLALSVLRCSAGPSQAVFTSPNQSDLHSGKCEKAGLPVGITYEVAPSPPLELYPLIVSGPINNRVDLVFFSDGYLFEERDKFIQDASRLAEDISTNQTFATVKPLLNFWAAFSPSRQSGIGVGGEPKE
ncbi:hypothetical protein C0995_015353 [Termitomyces sp. Mi166|nr:hypothetical protein C0995_015353 [Termitomyces sp. Mi166\